MLVALVVLHVLAAIVFSMTGKENLVLAMLTGRKPRKPD